MKSSSLGLPMALAVLAAAWVASDMPGFRALRRNVMFQFTHDHALTSCAVAENTTYRFRPITVQDAEDLRFPLDAEWFENLYGPTLVPAKSGGNARFQRLLDSFGGDWLKLRKVEGGGLRRYVPQTLLTLGFGPYRKDSPSVNVTLSQLAAGEGLPDEASLMYGGFMSLNDTYEAYSDLVDSSWFYRNDLFAGFLKTPAITAGFHANQAEKSATVQMVGSKLWLFMHPADFLEKFQAFPIRASTWAGHVCDGAFANTLLTYAVTKPGDVIAFPRGWPHFVLSLPGPNVMANFRADAKSDIVSPLPSGVSYLLRLALIVTLRDAYHEKRESEDATPSAMLPRRQSFAVPPRSVISYHDQALQRVKAQGVEEDAMVPFWQQLCARAVGSLEREPSTPEAVALDGDVRSACTLLM